MLKLKVFITGIILTKMLLACYFVREDKSLKIKNCTQVWKTRDLIYKGKVLVIKTLILSQIGFLAESHGGKRDRFTPLVDLMG